MARLSADGWPSDTPAAVVERGTLAWERQISGPLGRLGELARRASVASPALVVVGEAARAIKAIRRRPTILFTGLDATSFRTLGNVLHWPAQTIVPNPEGQRSLPHALASLSRGEVDWTVFADKLAVKTFWTAVADGRLDARVMRGAKIAALAAETARRLEQYCLCADVVITEKDARRTATLLGEMSHKGVLLVQGSHTPRGLRRRLEEAGAAVNHLILHRLAPHPELGRPIPDHDVVYFVSPAGVRAYANVYGTEAFQREVWCLGKATQRALAAYGVAAIVVRPPQPLLSLSGVRYPGRRQARESSRSALKSAAHGAAASGTAFGTQAGTPFDFTGLLIVLAATHLFFDPAPLHQFAEATHRLLNRLTLA